jgi:hypothetical protein
MRPCAPPLLTGGGDQIPAISGRFRAIWALRLSLCPMAATLSRPSSRGLRVPVQAWAGPRRTLLPAVPMTQQPEAQRFVEKGEEVPTTERRRRSGQIEPLFVRRGDRERVEVARMVSAPRTAVCSSSALSAQVIRTACRGESGRRISMHSRSPTRSGAGCGVRPEVAIFPDRRVSSAPSGRRPLERNEPWRPSSRVRNGNLGLACEWRSVR